MGGRKFLGGTKSMWVTAIVCYLVSGFLGVIIGIPAVFLLYIGMGFEQVIARGLAMGFAFVWVFLSGILSYGIVLFWAVRKKGRVVRL